MRGLVVVLAVLAGCAGHRGDAPAATTPAAGGALTWGPTPNGVDTPVVGLAMNATTARMAFDGRQFLAVWQDFRGIAATRISTDGKLADDANFFIPPAGSGRETPDVASDGTSFFVVWADNQDGAAWKVRGAQVQVGPDGALSAGDPVTVGTPADEREASVPRIAFGGGTYGVVWLETGYPSRRVRFTRLSTTGALLDSTPAILSESTLYNFETTQADDIPDITWAGDAFVPAWREYQSTSSWSISVCRAATATSVSVPVKVVTGTASTRGAGVSIAFDGTRVWVAWEEFDGTGSGPDGGNTKAAVRIRRMRVDGGTEEAAFTAQQTDPIVLHQPALVFEGPGGAMALAHADSLLQQVTFQRLAADTGAPLLPNAAVVSTGPSIQDQPVLAHGGGTALLSWRTNDEVLGTRLPAAGVPQDVPPIPIARSLNAEYQPLAAGNADGFAVTWLDTRLGKRRIFGAAVSPDGAPTLPAALGVIATPNALTLHALGAGDGQFLAVGIASGPGYAALPFVGQRFGLDGARRGSLITVSPTQLDSASVVSGAGEFLAVGYGQAAPAPLQAVRVDAAGNVLGTTTVASLASAGAATAASDGTRFLVAWPTSTGISGRLMGSDGTLVGSAALALTPSGGSWNGVGPALAFGGGAYLLVWYAGTSDRTVVGELVSTSGTVTSGPFAISSHAAGEVDVHPSVAFDGTRFVVVWRTMQTHDGGLATTHEIRYAPVSPAGVVGAVGFVASDDGSAAATDAISVAGGTAGRALVAYTGIDSPADYPLARTRIRFLGASPGPIGGGCAGDPDCAHGTCVDGVCCASACAGGALDCQACSVLGGAATNGTCGPVPDGQRCGVRGLCAAAVCVEIDAGQPPAADGSVDASADGSTGERDAGREGRVDAAGDRPGLADAHPTNDAGGSPGGTGGGTVGSTGGAAGSPGGPGGRTAGGGSDGGCSCATAGDNPDRSALLWLSVPALLLVRRRRIRLAFRTSLR